MLDRSRSGHILFLGAALILVVTMNTAGGQTLDQKLLQVADFVPTANSTEGRLIELAQHYKLPAGIEWVFDGSEAPSPSPLIAHHTVKDLLTSIMRDAPSYVAEVKDGVLIVRNIRWSEDQRNFLNLRLTEYNIHKGNVIDAQAALRFAIHATLHPERYAAPGFTGGYSYAVPRPESFSLTNISFSGRNIAVRQILNEITKQNADSLWVVELVVSRNIKGEPYFAPGSSPKDARMDFYWRILPFD